MTVLLLQERAMGVPRQHIPYRNSMMTMVLRDSLGGNCKTTMVANVSLADAFLDESISTCRFAQRVAMVANKFSVNEEADPALVVARLKQEVRDLKAELALLQVRPTALSTLRCVSCVLQRFVCELGAALLRHRRLAVETQSQHDDTTNDSIPITRRSTRPQSR